jgi:hypothetical protein
MDTEKLKSMHRDLISQTEEKEAMRGIATFLLVTDKYQKCFGDIKDDKKFERHTGMAIKEFRKNILPSVEGIDEYIRAFNESEKERKERQKQHPMFFNEGG